MPGRSETHALSAKGRIGLVVGVVALAAALIVILVLNGARPASDIARTAPTPVVTRPSLETVWADGELRLGIVGDSLTEGWMADAESGTYRERVRSAGGYPGELELAWVAVPGATSGEMQPRAVDVIADAEVVLIATGTNDTAVRTDLSILEAEYPALLAAVPADRALLCLGPWLGSTTANERMRELCERAGGDFIGLADLSALRGPEGEPAYPFTRDAYHPNQAGHDAIAQRVIDALTP